MCVCVCWGREYTYLAGTDVPFFFHSGPPLVPINNVAQSLPSGRLAMQSYHAVVKRKCSAYSNPRTLVPGQGVCICVTLAGTVTDLKIKCCQLGCPALLQGTQFSR